jgi:hypothetical protein
MTRADAKNWLENSFSDYMKEDSREESIFYLVKKIYDDFENRSCQNCKYYNFETANISYGTKGFCKWNGLASNEINFKYCSEWESK